MLALDQPLRFTPFMRPMVWGGRAFEAMGKPMGVEAVGESWEVSDHPLHRSALASPPGTSETLRSLMENQATALLGDAAAAHRQFPWLVKLLDCCDWLSVQVHPDQDKVRTLWPGEGSKTEAWFILSAAPQSRIFAGLKPGVGPAELRAALDNDTAADCLHSFTPRAGDCVFLPAGTVHAVGGGVVMAEIQQTSDATFRLFDWNRRDVQGKSRTLHIEESFAAIHWDKGPVTPIHVDFDTSKRQPLVECPFFHLEAIQGTGPFSIGGADKLQALMIFTGAGHWPSGEKWTHGQTWILPAAMKEMRCEVKERLTGLLCTLP